MKCVILASGRHEQLMSFQQPVSLMELLGVPLLDRLILNAKKAGISEFVLVTGDSDFKVRQHADRFAKRQNFSLEHVINTDPDQSDMVALSLLEGKLNSPFILSAVDSLFAPETVEALLQQPWTSHSVCLAFDEETNAKGLDFNTVVRVQVDAQRQVKAMEAGLVEFDGFDTRLCACTPAVLSAAKGLVQSGAKGGVTELLQYLVTQDQVKVMPLTGQFWSVIDSLDAFQRTEQALLAAANRTASDGPVKRHLLRKISPILTQFSLVFKLSLKQLSVYSFLLSALAALLLSFNHYLGLLCGGLMAFVAISLQLSRRELAVLTFAEDAHTRWLDDVLGQYGEVILLLGLLLNSLHRETAGMNPVIIGVLAIAGNLLFYDSMNRYRQLRPTQEISDEAVLMDEYINRDGVYLLVGLGAILNLPLFALSILMALFNAIVIRRLFVWKF